MHTRAILSLFFAATITTTLVGCISDADKISTLSTISQIANTATNAYCFVADKICARQAPRPDTDAGASHD